MGQALVSPDKISKKQETVRGLSERSEFRSTLIFWKIGRKEETIRLPILWVPFLLKKKVLKNNTFAALEKVVCLLFSVCFFLELLGLGEDMGDRLQDTIQEAHKGESMKGL